MSCVRLVNPEEQIVYILSGTVDFHIGDKRLRLGPGGLAAVPGGVVHHAEVVGEEVVLNLDIFTPARPEYAELAVSSETGTASAAFPQICSAA